MPVGKCCCWCEYEDCPRICVGSNPCTTRLVISGHHPADLRYHITYSNEGGFAGLFPDGCGLVGESEPNRSTSTGHTQLKTWTAGIRYWDSIDLTNYVCCGFEPSYTEHQQSHNIGSGVHVTGTCSRADLRYGGLRVLLRRDKIFLYGEWVCTVRVDVCLKYKRLAYTKYKTCRYETIQSTQYSLPPECAVAPLLPPGTYNGQCAICYDSSTGVYSVYPNPGDITLAPYPYPTCNQLTDEQWDTDPNVQEYCLWRSKHFVLPSIACGPVTVTLGPEDNQGNSMFTCCNGFNTPPILMYEPDDDPVAIPCGGESFTDCPRTNPTTTRYGCWNSPPFCPFGAITNNPPFCSENTGVLGGMYLNNCLGRWQENSRNQGWARTGGWTGDPKLLAEIEDTWTLHLDCSHSGS
jgi:hypothetical protein